MILRYCICTFGVPSPGCSSSSLPSSGSSGSRSSGSTNNSSNSSSGSTKQEEACCCASLYSSERVCAVRLPALSHLISLTKGGLPAGEKCHTSCGISHHGAPEVRCLQPCSLAALPMSRHIRHTASAAVGQATRHPRYRLRASTIYHD